MRVLLVRLLKSMNRLRLVHRPGSRISLRSLMPLVAMLPVALYAYVTQIVVTAKTEAREREVCTSSLRAMQGRLAKTQKRDAATCCDYAYWDDIYEQVERPTREWVEVNLDSGIGYSFGFAAAVVQHASGKVIWQSGMNPDKLAALGRYHLLRKCMERQVSSGFVVLGGEVYSCTAAPIRLAGGKGTPRGMVFVGRLVDRSVLADLASGLGSGTAFRGTDGRATFAPGPARTPGLEDSLTEITGPGLARQPTVEISRDRQWSYGILPVSDIQGRPIGLLADISSRAGVLDGLRAIRRMALFLMLLCGVVAIAGSSYLKNRALALRANRDELTGLYNHGYVQDRLRDLIELARRYEHPTSLLMVDIDHFKFVNDSHGHANGDRVLKAVADLLVETFRTTDVVARYGGEEFVVVLPETDLEEAQAVAERLRQIAQAHTVRSRSAKASEGSTGISFTLSVGVATFPDDATGSAELVMAADAALLEAKRTRNCVFAYRHILRDQGAEQHRLANLDSFLRDSSLSTIRPLVSAIDSRKPGSANHLDKTAEYAVAMARELGLSTQQLALVCKAALLHDLGEIGVPDYLLTKTGRLSGEETEQIRSHCAIGAQILSQSPSLAPAAELVLCHHERYDGTGYPNGLKGNDIPFISRIISVADSIDAMTSPRPYQETRSLYDALAEIESLSGSQFDPRVVEVAVRVLRRALDAQEHGKAAA